MVDRPQNKNLRPIPANIGRDVLPEGVRYTKPIRFTLPEALAARLEAMPKADRDALIREALNHAP